MGLYGELHGAGRVEHWAASSEPARGRWVLDLHGFNRGMASAAIQRAVSEVP